MYSKRVLDHFYNPRNVGEIEKPTAVVEVSNLACGDVMRLCVVVRDGRIAEARFKVQGCVPAVACGSWLTEWIAEKTAAQLRQLTMEQIETNLDGLPPASRHAALLTTEVVQVLLQKI